MAKMTKLYRLDMDIAKTLNIGQFNQTCKSILRAMCKIEKQNSENEDFKGSTGEAILQFAVKNSLWATRQVPEKYHTTWAYYVKLLKEKAGVYETGSIKGMSTEEYLDSDEPPEEMIEEEEEMEAA